MGRICLKMGCITAESTPFLPPSCPPRLRPLHSRPQNRTESGQKCLKMGKRCGTWGSRQNETEAKDKTRTGAAAYAGLRSSTQPAGRKREDPAVDPHGPNMRSGRLADQPVDRSIDYPSGWVGKQTKPPNRTGKQTVADQSITNNLRPRVGTSDPTDIQPPTGKQPRDTLTSSPRVHSQTPSRAHLRARVLA